MASPQMMVGRWLRIQVEHPTGMNIRQLVNYLQWLGVENPEDAAKHILLQWAANAEHSALLHRLFDGKEPLPAPPPLKYSYPDYSSERMDDDGGPTT